MRIPVFDIGRVLLRWEPEPVFSRLLGGDQAAEAFMQRSDFYTRHQEIDRGVPVDQTIADLAQHHPDLAEPLAAFYANWLDAVPGTVSGVPDVFEALADTMPVYGISNFSRELFDRTVPHFPFLQRFTGLVVSGDERLIKPDPAIFALFLTRYGLQAEQCLFIDDSPANVASAAAIGMKAEVFTSAAALSSLLQAEGLLPEGSVR